MGATLSTLSSILKDYYLPPVTEQLNNEVLLLNRLEARTQDFVGNQAVLPVHTGRSGGIGARPELGTLPSAGNQTYDKAVYDLRYLYGRVQVSGPSMAKTRSDTGAFLQALRSELDGIRMDLKRDLARQSYGDGSGKVATCGTTTSSSTVVLSSSEAIDKGYLYPGLPVDIGTAADPDAVVAASIISAVDASTPSITIASSVTTSSSDFVFIAGSAGDSVVYETDGLAKLVSNSGTVGGINSATAGNEYWKSLVIS